jgi:hypothetical protein
MRRSLHRQKRAVYTEEDGLLSNPTWPKRDELRFAPTAS